MGTILASAVISDAATILNDSGYGKWSQALLLVFLNNSQRIAATLKPDVSVTKTSQVLVAGTYQSVPTGGIGLIDIPRNMGTGGTTVGATITPVDKELFDALYPTWQSVTASAVVQHYMLDLRNPLKFWVYPQQPTSSFGYVDIIYPVTPAEVSAVTGAITLDDIYKGVLRDLICYQALSLESDPKNIQKAQAFYQMAERALGIKDEKEAQDDPNR